MIIFIRDYFNSEVKILLRNTGYAFIAIIILFIPGLIFDKYSNIFEWLIFIPYLIILVHLIIFIFRPRIMRSLIGVGIVGLVFPAFFVISGGPSGFWTFGEAFNKYLLLWLIFSSLLIIGVIRRDNFSSQSRKIFSLVWSGLWIAAWVSLFGDITRIFTTPIGIFAIVFTLQPILWFSLLPTYTDENPKENK